MKKSALAIGLVLALLVTVVAFGCAPTQTTPPEQQPTLPKEISFRVNYSYELSDDNACHVWIAKLRELSEKAFPEVKWDIKEYPAEALYTSIDGTKACMKGDIEVAYIPDGYYPAVFGEKSNMTQISSLPFLFKTPEHFYEYTYATKDTVSKVVTEPVGVYLKGIWASWGGNYCSRQPIRNLADLQGKKIRVSPAPQLVKLIGAAGCSVMTTAWAETASAIQTGTVDGFVTVTTVVYRDKSFKIAPYMTSPLNKIPGINSTGSYLFNMKWYDSLPKAITEKWDNEIFAECDKAVEETVQVPLLRNWKQRFSSEGAIIVEWSPEEQQKYFDIIKPARDAQIAVVGTEWINLAEEIGKKYEWAPYA